MVSEGFVSLALSPHLDGVPDQVLIELVIYLRRSGLTIQEVTRDEVHGDVVVLASNGRLSAKIAVKPDGFRVLKILPNHPTPQ